MGSTLTRSPVVWLREVGWDLIRDGPRFDKFSPWYGGRDFVGESVLKMPCPAGKSMDVSVGFVRF